MPKLDAKFIERALKEYKRADSLGNDVLYELCRKYPGHKEDREIIAKFWLIGRAYAAAVERTRSKNSNKNFKGEFVQEIRRKAIDDWFKELNPKIKGDREKALEIHYRLTKFLCNRTGLKKRSLSSKYLHFHFPKKFFIYDSRADKAIKDLIKCFWPEHKKCKCIPEKKGTDHVYAKFCFHCDWLVIEKIKPLIRRNLSPRELDTILLAWEKELRSS